MQPIEHFRICVCGDSTTQIGLVPGGSVARFFVFDDLNRLRELGSGNLNGVAVDTVNFPNRLESTP